MHFEVGNVWTVVTGPSEREWLWIRRLVSYPEKKFYKDYQTGRVRMGAQVDVSLAQEYKSGLKRFPAGLTKSVVSAISKTDHQVTVSIAPERVNPIATPASIASWLRDYQVESVQAVIEKERGLIWLPTGGGKTGIAIGVAEALPCRWLFLVSSKDLLHQTAEAYQRFTGREASIVGDGRWHEADPRFTVATSQTLALKWDDPRVQALLSSTAGLFVDEVHSAGSAQVYRVAMGCKNAFFRCGLSGTPLARTDHKSVLAVAAIGPVIVKIEAQRLIDAGWLSMPTIRMVRCENIGAEEYSTYQGAYGALIVRGAARNKLLVDLAVKADKPCLLFVKELNHGKKLVKALLRRGVQAEFVSGSKTSGERKASMKRLVRTDIDVICCSKIFQQGVDLPELRSLVIGTSGKSSIETIQRLGRGLRVTEEKSTVQVFDVYDWGARRESGHPTVLQAHAEKRKTDYEAAGFDVEVIESTDAV